MSILEEFFCGNIIPVEESVPDFEEGGTGDGSMSPFPREQEQGTVLSPKSVQRSRPRVLAVGLET